MCRSYGGVCNVRVVDHTYATSRVAAGFFGDALLVDYTGTTSEPFIHFEAVPTTWPTV